MTFAFRELRVWWEISGKGEWVKKGVKAQKENLPLPMRLKRAGRGQEFILAKQDFVLAETKACAKV